MEAFFDDIGNTIEGYYDQIVATAPRFLLGILVFCALYFVIGWMRGIAQNRLFSRMDDPLLAKFLGRILKVILVFAAFMVALQIIGLTGIVTGLFTGASVSALVIGFAFKDVGENFIAGIMLAFNRPFRIGDYVELNGQKGKVVALNLRDTQIKSYDGRDIFIPNAGIVKNPVVNYTIDGFLRKEFTIGIDYGSDVSESIRLILETLEGIPGILREDRRPSVAVNELGASSINLTVYFWYDTFDSSINVVQVTNRAIDAVVERLTAAGVYLPGDVIELKNYADVELKSLVNPNPPVSEPSVRKAG